MYPGRERAVPAGRTFRAGRNLALSSCDFGRPGAGTIFLGRAYRELRSDIRSGPPAPGRARNTLPSLHYRDIVRGAGRRSVESKKLANGLKAADLTDQATGFVIPASR